MTRSAALLFFIIATVVICLPAVVVSLGRSANPLPPGHSAEQTDDPGDDEPVAGSREIHLFLTNRQEVVTLGLEEYIVGVVMAEMPASFELEALKAQAVVARTYTTHRLRSRGGSGCRNAPEPADICSDSTHCQAWIDPIKGAERWPEEQRSEYLERIRQAVRETAGEVAVYRGMLIEAVYHSTCGGKTEASEAIWSGGIVSYLQSVDCLYCTHAPYYRKEYLLPFNRLESAFEQKLVLPVGPGGASPLQVASVTPGGRVALLKVNNTEIDGKEVRRLLELPSTAFTWELRENGVFFITRGHGHGVGLCQYGADGMAEQGKSYRQIISFYYTGTSISLGMP